MTRLQPLDLTDFTGGLNLRRNEFLLAQNESPDMLNVGIDPRGGILTRKGWTRWNATDIVASPTGTTWNPRHAYMHSLSDGDFVVYVANGTAIYASSQTASFASIGVTCGASPHLADFTSWGDVVYMACGSANPSHSRYATSAATALTDAATAFNDVYTTPVGGTMPYCDYVESHSGYLFAAGTKESAVDYPNRLRWSHPGQPEDWATADYLDIAVGGDKITGLKSFLDHLLIFKTDSVWALYGYDSDSWQLIRVSRSIGSPSPAAITRSESAVYFYSGSTRGGVYAYTGGEPIHLTSSLQETMDEITSHTDVFLGWVGRRLWCAVPWDPKDNPGSSYPGSVFVFDPEIGNGAWVRHNPALGRLACIIESSDIEAGAPLAAIHGSSGASCLMELESQTLASDQILEGGGQSNFNTRYRTPWLYAETPDVKKSWRRPRFLVGVTDQALVLQMNVYCDFGENPSRSQVITPAQSDQSFWRLTGALETNGFDWGDGSLWGDTSEGATLLRTKRGQGLGICKAVSLEFETEASDLGKAWSIDGIMLKYVMRRRTT